FPYERLTDGPVADTVFTDSTAIAGNTYYYVVTARTKAGSESRYSDEISIQVTAAEEFDWANMGADLWFQSPARSNISIRFTTSSRGRVSIRVYNALGEEVATVLDSVEDEGTHSVVWRCVGNSGKELPGGIYFLNYSTGIRSVTKKLLIVR
ncbi:MAG: T9SS type A sorting domain-containing protein, partial [candidate division WOR-3 bacterium]